jgi:streptomycin 6-kinase
MAASGPDPLDTRAAKDRLPSLDLPSAFIRRNEAAPLWLDGLPAQLAQLAERWSLTLGPPFPHIIINYVAPATRAGGTRCVLKVSRYVEETSNEIAALRLWDGHGAVRLLEADPESGALLLEYVAPGTMLLEVAGTDDDAATVIAAGILRQLWRPVPRRHGLRPLDSWCDAYNRNREALSRATGGFPAALFRRADAMRRELLTSTETAVVLHGDMHHYNVLRAQRAPWLTIDPKGLTGDRCFDVCQFFMNPGDGVPPSVNRRRLDIFCAELGLERARTKDWCFVHAMLNACWDFEDGSPWREAVAYAEETLTF